MMGILRGTPSAIRPSVEILRQLDPTRDECYRCADLEDEYSGDEDADDVENGEKEADGAEHGRLRRHVTAVDKLIAVVTQRGTTQNRRVAYHLPVNTSTH